MQTVECKTAQLLIIFIRLPNPFFPVGGLAGWGRVVGDPNQYNRGRIFSRVQPFYERAVSNLDRSMHRSLWV
jgi:hypothetical protein